MNDTVLLICIQNKIIYNALSPPQPQPYPEIALDDDHFLWKSRFFRMCWRQYRITSPAR